MSAGSNFCAVYLSHHLITEKVQKVWSTQIQPLRRMISDSISCKQWQHKHDAVHQRCLHVLPTTINTIKWGAKAILLNVYQIKAITVPWAAKSTHCGSQFRSVQLRSVNNHTLYLAYCWASSYHSSQLKINLCGHYTYGMLKMSMSPTTKCFGDSGAVEDRTRHLAFSVSSESLLLVSSPAQSPVLESNEALVERLASAIIMSANGNFLICQFRAHSPRFNRFSVNIN